MVQLGRYVAGKMQEKRVERKMRKGGEIGYQGVEGVQGGFVRREYAAVEGEQKRMIEDMNEKEMCIDEKAV